MLEYKRNQILLNLARSIFEEQNNLECLVTKIMKEARDLLKCERCAVFLVDLECCEEVMAAQQSHCATWVNVALSALHKSKRSFSLPSSLSLLLRHRRVI